MNFVKQNYPALLAGVGALYTLLSIINGMIKNPEAQGILAKILDALSFIQRAGASGSVKLPMKLSRKMPPTREVIVVPAAPVALLLIPMMLFMSSCGCFTASSPKFNTKECVTVRKVVDCTENVALQIATLAGPALASGLLAGAGFDVSALANAAETDAPGGGMCLLGAVEAAIPQPSNVAAAPALLIGVRSRVHQQARVLAAKTFQLDVPVDVKLRKADGTVTIVTLEAGVKS